MILCWHCGGVPAPEDNPLEASCGCGGLFVSMSRSPSTSRYGIHCRWKQTRRTGLIDGLELECHIFTGLGWLTRHSRGSPRRIPMLDREKVVARVVGRWMEQRDRETVQKVMRL